MKPEEALADNTRYKIIWDVLQALRAHDERFDAMVNKLDLNTERDNKINIIGVGRGGPSEDSGRDGGRIGKGKQGELPLAFPDLEDWREAIYAKLVANVGSRRYWETWAGDIAKIAARHVTRITALLNDPTTQVQVSFDEFLTGLRANLNDGITWDDAIEMLAQHLISRPVFDALFQGYSFAEHNPVAQTMDRMLVALDEHQLDDENASLDKFYESVRVRAAGIDNPAARQRLLVELYDSFFATAFKKTVDKLGIVYTPVEIVDFIIRSADWALREVFGKGLTDGGVHILDGFAGTGTFITRLLASGLIYPDDLARKYTAELHANEILLLAYYIAAINIETTYQDLIREHATRDEYIQFPGLVLADTFQMYEDGDIDDLGIFTDNNNRVQAQTSGSRSLIVVKPGGPPRAGR
jgi:predicted helicase